MCSKILRMTAFLSINLATINNCFHANYTYKFYTRIHIIYSAFLKVFVKANVSQLQNSICILLKNNQLWNLRRNISQDASRCFFIFFITSTLIKEKMVLLHYCSIIMQELLIKILWTYSRNKIIIKDTKFSKVGNIVARVIWNQ